MSEKRQEYINKLKAKIDEWNTEISDLAQKAGRVKEEKKAEYKKWMETLSTRRKNLEEKITNMKEAEESSWEGLKYGVESSWEALKEKYAEAKSIFKKDIEDDKK